VQRRGDRRHPAGPAHEEHRGQFTGLDAAGFEDLLAGRDRPVEHRRGHLLQLLPAEWHLLVEERQVYEGRR
jgi:hypothetical protein